MKKFIDWAWRALWLVTSVWFTFHVYEKYGWEIGLMSVLAFLQYQTIELERKTNRVMYKAFDDLLVAVRSYSEIYTSLIKEKINVSVKIGEKHVQENETKAGRENTT